MGLKAGPRLNLNRGEKGEAGRRGGRRGSIKAQDYKINSTPYPWNIPATYLVFLVQHYCLHNFTSEQCLSTSWGCLLTAKKSTILAYPKLRTVNDSKRFWLYIASRICIMWLWEAFWYRCISFVMSLRLQFQCCNVNMPLYHSDRHKVQFDKVQPNLSKLILH